MDQLRYDIERRDDVIHVELSGALDLATRPVFADLTGSVLGGTAGSVVIDLSGLEFLDSTGVVELIRTARRAGVEGVALRFVGPVGGAAKRTADLIGLAEILGWEDPDEPIEVDGAG